MSLGRIVGGIIGGVIGFLMGGPSGAYYGFMAGSMVGGLIDPGSLPDQYGPRLRDLKPQGSDYGRPIPIIYGTIGIQGNVIWAADLVEVATTTEQGGKGGGPTQSTTTYSYFANFAVSLCEGESTVGRIWAGPEKRLIYDGANLEGGGELRIYSGSEDQLPDPLIEGYLGVGNVPAYRGTCYIVLENFPVEKDGNMIPFLTVEVGAVGSDDLIGRTVTSLGFAATPNIPSTNAEGLVDPETGLIWSLHPSILQNTVEVRVNSDITETQIRSFSVPALSTSMDSLVYIPGIPNEIWAVGEQFGSFKDQLIIFNADAQSYTETALGSYHGTAEITTTAYDPLTFKLLAFRFGGGVGVYEPSTRTAPSYSSFNIGDGFATLGTIWVTKVLITPNYFAAFYYGSSNGVILRNLLDYSFYAQFACYSIEFASVFYDEDRDVIVVLNTVDHTSPFSYQIIDVAGATMTNHTFVAATGADTVPAPSANIESGLYYGGKYIFGANTNGVGTGTTLYIVDPDTLTTEHTYTYEAYDAGDLFLMTDPLLGPVGDKDYIFSFDSDEVKRMYFKSSGSATPTSILLSEIVADLSERAGLTSGQYDVTALTDIVDGYAISVQTSIRSAIDALRPAYYFDAVESGSIVKFVKRGGAIAAVITTDDLAAHQDGETEAPDPMLLTRQMEVELPRILNVNYLLAATDYSPATKLSKRLIGSSGQESSLEMPLVLTDTKAQEIADVNLYVAWLQRIGHSFVLPRRYTFLEPTDIVSIDSHSIRIIKISYTPSGLLKCEGLRDDATAYSPNVVVTETLASEKTVFLAGTTTLELM